MDGVSWRDSRKADRWGGIEAMIEKTIFERCKENAENEIAKMREAAIDLFGDRRDIIIGVNGSVARREYTSGSDVDHFFLSTEEKRRSPFCHVGRTLCGISSDEKQFREMLKNRGLIMPAIGGVFEKTLAQEKLLCPIGGDDDTNQTLTRRMLFLLEGEWIFNSDGFENLRRELISKYVADDLDGNKLAMYLLNDIIRYWRTICIDFEFKTSGGKKARALRLAKLRMSRMLLCFAGMIAVSRSVNLEPQRKRARLVELFSQQGIERLDALLGPEFEEAKSIYGSFLTKLDNPEFRSKLDQKGREGMETQEYQEMVQLAREFKAELVKILLGQEPAESTIVKAILL